MRLTLEGLKALRCRAEIAGRRGDITTLAEVVEELLAAFIHEVEDEEISEID